jgi:membrane protein YqaA with SNARE-associated domain
VRSLLTYLYQVLWRLNGLGLLLLGILDSSFLFLPFGNAFLLIAMAAREHARWPYFAAMAAAGSVLGSFITDAISRKGGEVGLERKFSPRRLDYVKKKITKNAGWTLGLAALMPPPFPFTPFVAAAAVLQYPRKKLLATVDLGRLGRFAVDGLLAVFVRQEDFTVGRVSGHVLCSSRNTGSVPDRDRSLCLYLVQTRKEWRSPAALGCRMPLACDSSKKPESKTVSPGFFSPKRSLGEGVRTSLKMAKFPRNRE